MGSAISKLCTPKKRWRKKQTSPPPADAVQQADQIPVAAQESDTPPDPPDALNSVESEDVPITQTIDAIEPPPPPPFPTSSYPIPKEEIGGGNNALAQMYLIPPRITHDGALFEPPPRPIAAPDVVVRPSHVEGGIHLEESIGPTVRGRAYEDMVISDDLAAQNTKRFCLWGKAITILKETCDVELDVDRENAQAPVKSLIEEVERLREEVDKKRLKYKDAKGDDVFVADKIFSQLKKYAKIGDIALQHNPDVVALVWAGFRFLLDVGVAYSEDLAGILSSLGYLSWAICCGAIYEHLYMDLEQGSIINLQRCLINQYVSILEYLLCAKQHLQKNTGVQTIQSLSSTLADLLQRIRDSEEETREQAELIEKEAMTMERLKQNESRNKLEGHLKEVRGQLRMVETILISCHESHESIKRLRQFVDKQVIPTALDWVSTTQFGKTHLEHCRRRTPNTCLWLTKNHKFDAWLNSSRSSSSVLWLRGGAGTGKTILASFAIELLKKNALQTGDCVAYFYCSRTHTDKSDPGSILRALVRQVCLAYSPDGHGLPHALVELKDSKEDSKERECTDILSVKESTDLIIKLSRQLTGLWIVLDALDECDKETRKELFSALEAMEEGGKGIRIFVTGRNEGDIVAYMDGYENYLIEPGDNLMDIECYIREELDKLYKDPTKRCMVDDIKRGEKGILAALQENVDGMFLSIHLRMQALARETTIEGVADTLAVFPHGLTTMYDEMFKRIRQQSTTDQSSALRAIQWLFYAIDDFSPKTILQALNVDLPSPIKSDETINWRIDNLLHVCCGLIVYDRETGILRFSHTTVRQYLDEGPNDCVKGGQEWILDRCLSVLTCTPTELPDPSSLTSSRQDLFTYAMRNWGIHLSKPGIIPIRSWSNFFDPSYPPWEFWAWNVGRLIPTLKAPAGEPISLVWAVCYYGLIGIAEESLHAFTANCTNLAGSTPLHYLAEKGKLTLLEKMVEEPTTDLNARDNGGLTPLMAAVKCNRVDNVRFLLGSKRQSVVPQIGDGDVAPTFVPEPACCDISLEDKSGLTAIHHAAAGGHRTILEDLLREPVLNINHKSKAGDTALSLAVAGGHASVVETLLGHKDIDPNCQNGQMEPPLFTAARLDHRAIFDLLITHEGIDANCSMGADTLLIKAVDSGQVWLLELLLKGKNLDIDRQGAFGWTAVYNAVRAGSLEALKVLLSHGADVNTKSNQSSTPLHVAAECGNTEIVKLLLSHGADIHSSSETGHTALHIAAQYNSVGSAQELVSHGADVNAENKEFCTPLHAAAENGDTEIIKLLLSHGADIHSSVDTGNTALHLAADGNHRESAQELLSHGADVNARANDFWTPLHNAAAAGHPEIIKFLLSHRADIHSISETGETALHMAARSNHVDAIRVLLWHGADLNMVAQDTREGAVYTKHSGCTPLQLACDSGSTEAVKFLLQEPGIDFKTPTNHGTTALLSAAESGYVEICEMLLERHDETDRLQEVDGDGDTPLLVASKSGKTRIVELVLERGEYDINYQSQYGYTALTWAASEGHSEVVEMLLRVDGIDINIVDAKGKSAFDVARDCGHQNVMKLLKPDLFSA